MPTSEDLNPLVQMLKRVAHTLRDADIPFALAGSFAAYARGGAPCDHDVDFVIKESDAEKALTALLEGGFRAEIPPEGWLVKVYQDDIMIDLIHHPCQRPVTDEMLADTDELSVNACHMKVLRATELMIHKILSYGPHYCDMTRALPVARSLREQIDWTRVLREVAHSPYAYAFLTLADRLGIMSLAEAGDGAHEPGAADREAGATTDWESAEDDAWSPERVEGAAGGVISPAGVGTPATTDRGTPALAGGGPRSPIKEAI